VFTDQLAGPFPGIGRPLPHFLPQISKVRRIGIALFNGFKLSDTASIAEVFESANAIAEKSKRVETRYELCLLSVDGGKIDSSSALCVCTEAINARREADELHALFIAGGAAMHSQLHDVRLIRWLREVSQANEHIYSIGTGRLLLEANGLTQITTERTGSAGFGNHQRNQPSFEPSDSPADALQSALRVVEDDLGADIVRQIAGGSEARITKPFTTTERADHAGPVDEKLQAAARWLETHCDRPISVSGAAEVAAMSERTFLRRFKSEIGLTPSDYLLKVRLDMSCRLLAETDLPADKIARRCGLGSGGNLSRLFRAHLETTPIRYRSENRKYSACRDGHD
jgi:transcriptional regulator GlxA family with amidase domain